MQVLEYLKNVGYGEVHSIFSLKITTFTDQMWILYENIAGYLNNIL